MSSRKTKPATLIRVRDNQRRCRARKREYVLELERKLQEYQVAGIQPDVETYQSIVKRLKDENRKLRDLLGQAGVSKACVEAHLREGRDIQEGSGDSNGTDRQVLPYTQESNTPNGLERPQAANPMLDNERITPSLSFNDLLDIPFLDLSEDIPLFEFPQAMPLVDLPSALPTADRINPASSPGASPPPDICDNPAAWSLPPLSLIPGDLGSFTTAQRTCDATLCTVAYEMIRRHNKNGVDMTEIGIRLWNGFIKGGQDGEGCKVENKLLFSVLDYISG